MKSQSEIDIEMCGKELTVYGCDAKSTMTDYELIEHMQSLTTDHAPDGWPAVRMSEITQLTELASKTLAIREMVTTDRESKESFVGRVSAILGEKR